MARLSFTYLCAQGSSRDEFWQYTDYESYDGNPVNLDSIGAQMA